MLFEWLARTGAGEQPVAFEDQAEQRVLWDLEAALEKHLVEPCKSDYRELWERPVVGFATRRSEPQPAPPVMRRSLALVTRASMTLAMVVRSSSESWSRSARRASTWLLGALSGRRSASSKSR